MISGKILENRYKKNSVNIFFIKKKRKLVKMKNIIVVTGGAGFVGSNLINFLIKKTKFNIYKY